MREKRRFLILAAILVLMIMTYVGLSVASQYTKTRLIQRKEDEVKAYYTALYFDGTGEGSAIALDNNNGYVTFNLMNYIGEDVTERDIVYEIATRDYFYTEKAEQIPNDKDSEGNTTKYPKIHVLDVWGQPQEVGRDTWKYTFGVESNNGELYNGDPIDGSKVDATDYMFKYEKLDNGSSSVAVGKTHNVTLKVSRDASLPAVVGTEKITVVVQLLKPYKEVYLINMTISERLIIFSNHKTTEFEHDIEELHIQTADIYSHTVNGERLYGTNKFSSAPLQVTLTWSNLIFNEILTNNFPTGVLITNVSTLSSNAGSITLLIPQGADFKLQFYETAAKYQVTAKVEIWDINISSPAYVLYDQNFGGYTASEIGKNNSNDNTIVVPSDSILVLNNSKTGLVH